jgi:hypothetical protein
VTRGWDGICKTGFRVAYSFCYQKLHNELPNLESQKMPQRLNHVLIYFDATGLSQNKMQHFIK